MSNDVHYTLYHPKWYRHPVSVWWWLTRWPYTRFVLRELTSLAVGFFALLTLWQLRAVGEGEAAYQGFLHRLESPAFILLNLFLFGGILFHALTWFHAAPKAMVVRIMGRRVPDAWIITMNYLAWISVSTIVAWIWIGG